MDKYIKRNITTIFLLFIASNLMGRHIIGGEITYVCNGNGSYTFTMSIYRDCGSDGAEFDDPAVVTIYRGNGSPFSLFEEVPMVGISGPIQQIPPDVGPCMEVLPVCVEKATYEFTTDLPFSSQSYHIVYQRCCRNNTINNLVNPEESGATYTIELTSEAQSECNDSPVFNDFPPIVICAGQDINFDHSATDPDGDQLVYSFCSPLLGGGVEGTPEMPGDPSACNGVAPDPACPPPFPNVNFLLPTFDALNPMAGDPQVTIDPNTGLISGVPDILGQFVVGVCVEEYRNGVLMSTVRRDFQFNVTSCTPVVDALIGADEVINDNEFIILSCGNNTVVFDNQSIQQQNIVDYQWSFDLPSGPAQPSEWDPSIEFPGLGTYNGTLLLNPDTECSDTAFIEVNILPEINADFSFVYDTCVSAPVVFTDLSTTGSGTMVSWDWNFGDGNNSTDQHPEHLYMVPGNLPVSLTVTDINGCMDTEVIPIPYFPVPALVVIEPTSFYGCEPLEVFFSNLSFPVDSTYDIIWDFGDGTTANEVSPTHVYEEGVYSVSVDITSPIGCHTDASWDDWVTVLGSPVAGFDYNPKSLNNFESTATFTDLSQDAVEWEWIFGTHGTSNLQNPVFTFPDTGKQEVLQIVFHESGCPDTAVAILDVIPEIRYYMPNAFSPNYDAINDLFMGTGVFGGITDFSMTIWNRWGEMIFETNDPFEGWNGRKNNVGVMSPVGVYIYLTTFTGPRGEPFRLKGHATLIK